MNDTDYDKVRIIIDTIRPYIQADGGDVEFVEIKDGIVYVNIQQTTVPVTCLLYTSPSPRD